MATRLRAAQLVRILGALVSLALLACPKFAHAQQETCIQCKHVKCLKGLIAQKQAIAAGYDKLAAKWAKLWLVEGAAAGQIDFQTIQASSRVSLYFDLLESYKAFDRQVDEMANAVGPPSGCSFSGPTQIETDSFLKCETNQVQLRSAQAGAPCKEIAQLLDRHEGVHRRACNTRLQKGAWTVVESEALGQVAPYRMVTPAGKAREEASAYRMEITALKDLYKKALAKCQWRATGQDGPTAYSGVICNLAKPFTVTGNHPLVPLPLKFVPSSPTAGTMSYSAKWQILTMTGSARYTVEDVDTDSPRIALVPVSTLCAPVACSGGSGPASIQLVPLDTDECRNP
jgi:hypothetical protein